MQKPANKVLSMLDSSQSLLHVGWRTTAVKWHINSTGLHLWHIKSTGLHSPTGTPQANSRMCHIWIFLTPPGWDSVSRQAYLLLHNEVFTREDGQLMPEDPKIQACHGLRIFHPLQFCSPTFCPSKVPLPPLILETFQEFLQHFFKHLLVHCMFEKSSRFV